MSNKKNKEKVETPEIDLNEADNKLNSEDADAQSNFEMENETAAEANDVTALKDKYIRLLAEFENFKKRTLKEKLDLMNSAAQNTMTVVLPVLDDFDRAKQVAEDENSEEVFSEGVNLVYNKLHSVLANKGLKAMESNGLPFDAELFEAITEIPAPTEDMKGKVVDTVEKGYYLNDKIIRHAKVVVGR